MAATPLFAATGAYLAFFHSTLANIAHVAFAMLVTVVAVVLCTYLQGFHWALVAASKGLIGMLLTAFVIPFIQIGYGMLRTSADESTFDALTGLLNRRGLKREIAKKTLLDSSAQTPWTVVLIDVDDFKSVNDTYGHGKGDRVLVGVADVIRRSVEPDIDVLAARVGGDEFVVAAQVPRGHGLMLAERIRESLRGATDPVISASVGVATGEDRRSTVFELITTADHAMYSAKQWGGDRVIGTDHTSDRVELAADD